MLEQMNWCAPWLVLTGGILFTLLVSVIRVETKRPAQIASIITLIAVILSCLPNWSEAPQLLFNGALEASILTRGLLVFFSGLGLLFILGGSRYLTKEKIHLSDYYHLLLLLIFGASVLSSAKDLLAIFIALELMSLPVYTLAGFRRNDPRSNEASIKYFIYGGAFGAIFLLGSSFIFGACGTLKLIEIFNWSISTTSAPSIFYLGQVLVLIAFSFKVAAVPFHFWKPDVYEGSPVTVTGVMTTIVSAAAFVTLARLIHMIDLNRIEWQNYAIYLKNLIRVLAISSLVLGSVVLITQSNLKRMLAYSAISNTGYILLGILGSFYKEDQIASVYIYLFGYAITSCGLFILLSQSEATSDQKLELIDLTGLLKRAPFTAVMWSIFFLSMVGMPFTIGFFIKYSVFMSAISAGETPIVVIAALCAVVSAYGYLRPIALMVMRDADPSAGTWKGSLMSNAAVVIAGLIVVGLGLAPNEFLHILKGIPLIH